MPSTPASFPIDRDAPVYVAGHRGLVGSAVWRHLESEGFTNLLGRSSTEVDLRDREAVRDFMLAQRPQVVIDAAARVGGIHANSTYPADFLSDNLRIQVNLLDASVESGVGRFLFLGSSCIYPKHAPQPIPEEALLTGVLEPTNDAYAIAKISGILHVRALRRQYGLRYISAMPTNLYGPGDNFHPQNSHVLPALVRRFFEATATGARSVTCWGTGAARREFMHVDDLADACLFLLENYDDANHINVGTGSDITIRDLAEQIAGVAGYDGEIVWDRSKPDGTPRKLLDTSRLEALGWTARTELRDGLASTYRWFVEHEAEARV